MMIEKQCHGPVTITVRLERKIGHDKNRSPYWMLYVFGKTVGGYDNLITYQSFDDEDQANKNYMRTKIYWGIID